MRAVISTRLFLVKILKSFVDWRADYWAVNSIILYCNSNNWREFRRVKNRLWDQWTMHNKRCLEIKETENMAMSMNCSYGLCTGEHGKVYELFLWTLYWRTWQSLWTVPMDSVLESKANSLSCSYKSGKGVKRYALFLWTLYWRAWQSLCTVPMDSVLESMTKSMHCSYELCTGEYGKVYELFLRTLYWRAWQRQWTVTMDSVLESMAKSMICSYGLCTGEHGKDLPIFSTADTPCHLGPVQ